MAEELPTGKGNATPVRKERAPDRKRTCTSPQVLASVMAHCQHAPEVGVWREQSQQLPTLTPF